MRAAGIAVALALAAAPALANPVDSFGLGSRSTAMGSAVSADARDFSANYYNPSGLALARGTDISVGYVYVAQKLEMNGHDSQVDPVRALVGGVVAPGAIWTIPFAFGLAVHLPDHRLSRARSMRAEDPRWVLWDNRPQLLYLSANLAIRPFGITLLPLDDVDFSLVYRGEAKIELGIDAELRGDVDTGLFPVPVRYELESTTVNAFIPRQVVVGARIRRVERLTVALDVTWVNWAAYESPISRTRTILDVQNIPAGFELPPNPKPTGKVDPDFRNRLVPRIGVEYRLPIQRQLDVPLRAGYVFEHSPVPPQTGRTNFVDNDRHVLSLGTGLVWDEPGELLPGNLRFDTHVQWAILPTRVTEKENAADYVGDFRAGGTQLGVGATLSLGFL